MKKRKRRRYVWTILVYDAEEPKGETLQTFKFSYPTLTQAKRAVQKDVDDEIEDLLRFEAEDSAAEEDELEYDRSICWERDKLEPTTLIYGHWQEHIYELTRTILVEE